jgi:hypothetical protein
MFAFATKTDVAARWRTLSTDESTLVDALLEDASDMIRVRWPDVDERLTAGTLERKTLVRVVSAMVRRAMMNRGSEGVATTNTVAGPFAQNATFTNADGNLYLTAQDILDLSVATERSHVGWLA